MQPHELVRIEWEEAATQGAAAENHIVRSGSKGAKLKQHVIPKDGHPGEASRSRSRLALCGFVLTHYIQRQTKGMRMDQPVTVSARAAKRIAEILKSEPQPAMLRVAVTGGGCSGFQYNFALDEVKAEDDLVLERDGAVVLIDSMSLDFLRGAEIDFVDDLIGASFKINNPNAQSSCGCGTSFSI